MGRSYRLALIVVDTAIVAASALVAVWLRLSGPVMLPEAVDTRTLVAPIAPLIVLGWVLTLAVAGAYRRRHWGVGVQEYRQVLVASVIFLLALGFAAFLTEYPLSRGFTAILVLIGVPALLVGRLTTRRLLQRARARGRFLVPTLVVGDPASVEDVVDVLRREAWLGYQPIGLVTPDTTHPLLRQTMRSNGSGVDAATEVTTPGDLLPLIDRTGAKAVIFTNGSLQRGREFNEIAQRLERHDTEMIVVPALTDVAAQRIQVVPVAGLPLMHVGKPQAERSLTATKRLFDIITSLTLILILSPLLLITSLVIKLGDGGPVLFTQTRVGRSGRVFRLFKFRSMVIDAERIRAETLEEANEADGALFKMRNDPRITPFGRFIRRYSIDELPQLVNVIRGEMSLVGPRPALEGEVALYEDRVRRRLDVRPGITGLWQVSGRSDLSWDDTVRLDLYYVNNWSLVQDMVILLRTFKAVLKSNGAY